MKKLLLILLLLHTQTAHSQLSADSLRSICIRQYKSTHSRECNEVTLLLSDYPEAYNNAKTMTIEAIELFNGYFPGVKIYSVFCHAPSVLSYGAMFPVLYDLSDNTGQWVSFENTKAFNEFIKSAKIELVNLDKAYLCLFFMMHAPHNKNITFPNEYRGFEVNGVFSENQRLVQSEFPFDEGFSLRANSRDEAQKSELDKSTNRSITMFATNYTEPYSLCYHFKFDEAGDVATATADTLELQPRAIFPLH